MGRTGIPIWLTCAFTCLMGCDGMSETEQHGKDMDTCEKEGQSSLKHARLHAVITSLLDRVPGPNPEAKAQAMGVGRNTVYRWQKGERPSESYFLILLDAAGASGAYRAWCLDVWRQGADEAVPADHSREPTPGASPDNPLHVVGVVELGKRTRNLLRRPRVAFSALGILALIGGVGLISSPHIFGDSAGEQKAAAQAPVRPSASAATDLPRTKPPAKVQPAHPASPLPLTKKSASSMPTATPPASQPSIPQPTSAPPTPAECHWRVTWDEAGVYSKPTQKRALMLKRKSKGQPVGPYCDTFHSSEDGHTYLKVQTGSSPDGIGWMRFDAVTKIE